MPVVQDDVAQLHRAWEELHTRLREQEQCLSAAIAAYGRGRAGKPETLMEEVEQMRAECAVRFKALMDAVRAQSPASN